MLAPSSGSTGERDARVLVIRIGAGTGKLDLRRKSLGEGICRIGQDRDPYAGDFGAASEWLRSVNSPAAKCVKSNMWIGARKTPAFLNLPARPRPADTTSNLRQRCHRRLSF